jgi:hypothetical protein
MTLLSEIGKIFDIVEYRLCATLSPSMEHLYQKYRYFSDYFFLDGLICVALVSFEFQMALFSKHK